MRDGQFVSDLVNAELGRLLNLRGSKTSLHSVTTLSRHHQIYNDAALASIRRRVLQYGAPLSSFHLRCAAGVWNLHREFKAREDHPYKYGYGMIMHGGYRYVDLAADDADFITGATLDVNGGQIMR